MKKIYLTLATLLCVSLLNVFAGNAPKTVDIQKLPDGTVITIDGKADEAVWAGATEHKDFQLYPVEASQHTGAADMAGYWKAVWGAEGIYVNIGITADDVSSDGTVGADWTQDGIEIYFSVGTPFKDGLGKQEWMDGVSNGHYDFYAKTDKSYVEAADKTSLITYMGIGEGSDAALVKTGNLSVLEVFVKWSNLVDKDGNAFTAAADKTLGFDICLVDNDNNQAQSDALSPRTRQFWSANGFIEPWDNADSIATAKLSTVVVPTSVKGANLDKEVTVYVQNNVLIISKSINAQLVNMAGQKVLTVNGNSANVSGLQKGAYILVSNDNKLHKKLIIK